MAEENIGQDNPQDVPETEPQVEAPTGPQDTVSKEEYDKIVAERDEQFGRAKRAEEALKGKEETPEPKEELPAEALSTDEKVDLRLEGYSKEEISFIETNRRGRDLDDVKKDPFVVKAIEGLRSEQSANDGAPDPSSTVPTFTPENKTWANMTPQERKANYQQALGTVQGRGTKTNE